MQVKALEVRDRATCIPVLAVDMNVGVPGMPTHQAQWRLLRRAGYPCDGRPNILLTHLAGQGKATNDPYEWGGRTYPVAHNYIIDNWCSLKDGDVVDVEFILGEASAPKKSEVQDD